MRCGFAPIIRARDDIGKSTRQPRGDIQGEIGGCLHQGAACFFGPAPRLRRAASIGQA
jgi:hypothetical protein